MQIKWTDLANADLDQVEAYISQENSIAVAIDIVLKIIDATQLILSAHHPGKTCFVQDRQPPVSGLVVLPTEIS